MSHRGEVNTDTEKNGKDQGMAKPIKTSKEDDEMRFRTISLALAAAAIMVLGVASTGLAFHDGGVASCGSCHSMHNSKDGLAKIPGSTQFTGVRYLLQNSDQSSVCLSCHGTGANRSGYHVWTALTDFAAGAPA